MTRLEDARARVAEQRETVRSQSERARRAMERAAVLDEETRDVCRRAWDTVQLSKVKIDNV